MTHLIPLLSLLLFSQSSVAELPGAGELGVIIEREPADVQILYTTSKSSLSRIIG
ncbi:MAG: hypothetical protein ABGX71_01550 [Methyloprofundus sp.]|uniref:hypothetical protein n=1 Tax=Methyloprofundus sp. TaxID=2020875 RepID=UPI0026203002|nr:hypothetical protein [Methyloprofundus sp.]